MKNEQSREVHKRLMGALDVSKQRTKFTPAEQRCIGRNIREKVREGMDMNAAIAASINICAPKKAKNLSEVEMIKLWKEISESEQTGAGSQTG